MTQPANTPDFGICWGCVEDLTMPSVMVSGFRVVAEAVVRRWSTNRGELIDDPNYGTNVTDAISDDLSPRDIAYLEQRLAAEAQKDERVKRCVVEVALTTAGLLTVTGSITTAAGPFRLVVAVTAATTTLLLVSP